MVDQHVRGTRRHCHHRSRHFRVSDMPENPANTARGVCVLPPQGFKVPYAHEQPQDPFEVQLAAGLHL